MDDMRTGGRQTVAAGQSVQQEGVKVPPVQAVQHALGQGRRQVVEQGGVRAQQPRVHQPARFVSPRTHRTVGAASMLAA